MIDKLTGLGQNDFFAPTDSIALGPDATDITTAADAATTMRIGAVADFARKGSSVGAHVILLVEQRVDNLTLKRDLDRHTIKNYLAAIFSTKLASTV